MKIVSVVFLSLIFVTIIHAEDTFVLQQSFNISADQLIPAEKMIPANAILQKKLTNIPRRDEIIGEVFQAGDTFYDYQSNGCVGKMIAVDALGRLHVTWMDAYYLNLGSTRKQKYNYRLNDEFIWEDGVTVDEGDRSGYGCLWQTNSEDSSFAIVFSHAQGGPFSDDFYSSYAAVDLELCHAGEGEKPDKYR